MATAFELPFSLNYSDLSTSSPSEVDDQFNDDLLSEFGDQDLTSFYHNGLLSNLPTEPTSASASHNPPSSKRRSRRPPSTAAKRATHNAIERARRESLNGRFIELARALPNMASVKRPSKSAIVIKSLEFVYSVQHREVIVADQLATLRREVEDLRSKLSVQSPKSSSPCSSIPTFDHLHLHPTFTSPVTSPTSSTSSLTPPPVDLTPSAVDYFTNLFVAPTMNDYPIPTPSSFDWNALTSPISFIAPPIYA